MSSFILSNFTNQVKNLVQTDQFLWRVLEVNGFSRGSPVWPHVIDWPGGDGLEVRLPVSFLLLLLRCRHFCHQAGARRVVGQRCCRLLQSEVDRVKGWVRTVARTFAGAVLAVWNVNFFTFNLCWTCRLISKFSGTFKLSKHNYCCHLDLVRCLEKDTACYRTILSCCVVV